MIEGPRRRDGWAIAALALAVRLLFCLAIYPGLADQFGAGDDYDRIAASLVRGEGYAIDGRPAAAERLPLYPLLLAGGMVLFGSAPWPWQLAQSIAGALTCVLVWAISRRYASRAGAAAAALCCALHPTLILYAARPFTETLYILLVVLLVVAMAGAHPKPDLAPRAAGVVWGLQLLTKSTALLHGFVFLTWLWRRRFGMVMRAAAWCALLVSPWMGWSLLTAGDAGLFAATGGRTLYHGLYISRHVSWATPAGDLNREAEIELWKELTAAGIAIDADGRVRDRFAGQAARMWIREHPAETARLWVRNLVLTWYMGRSRLSMLAHGVIHGVLLLGAAIGLARMWRGGGATREIAVVSAVLVAVYGLAHAAIHPAVRYILPAVPLLALLAAGATSAGDDPNARPRIGRVWR